MGHLARGNSGTSDCGHIITSLHVCIFSRLQFGQRVLRSPCSGVHKRTSCERNYNPCEVSTRHARVSPTKKPNKQLGPRVAACVRACVRATMSSGSQPHTLVILRRDINKPYKALDAEQTSDQHTQTLRERAREYIRSGSINARTHAQHSCCIFQSAASCSPAMSPPAAHR